MNFQPLPVPELHADQRFRLEATAMGLDPDNLWVGGYAQYEMGKLAVLLATYGIEIKNQRALEFGCNVGASAVVLQHLGATVTAIDVSKANVQLAGLNALRFGLKAGTYQHVPDTRELPFAADSFDIVVCASVLEYVAIDQLSAVQSEIDRILRRGGLIVVTGTSSRLSPKEVHSGRWLANYLPKRVERVLRPGKTLLQRGIWPYVVRNGFGSHYESVDLLDGGDKFLQTRSNFHPPNTSVWLRLIVKFARLIRVSPGLLLPNISCILRKAKPTMPRES